MNTLLNVEHLKTYFWTHKGGRRANDDVNLQVCEKEVVAIVGESGCGKSTAACLSSIDQASRENR